MSLSGPPRGGAVVRTTTVLTALLVALGVCILADGTGVAQAQGTVYLTFDDGPVRPGTEGNNTRLDGSTPAVLTVLRERRVKATFFVVGEQARKHSDLVYREYAQGHSVQNHSDTHPHLTRLTNEEIRRELRRANRAIVGAGAPRPHTFRPPYGSTNDRVKRVGASLGLSQILWTPPDSNDWEDPPPREICARVMDMAAPGAVILLHDGSGANTDEALPCIIGNLRAKGYRFGTL
jgi:peptidoglycan/xylan/chitin deacetylase (PgdA/CDA1 family)